MGVRVAMEIIGHQAVMAQIEMLPESLGRSVLRKAVNKAASPVVKAAKRNIPKGKGLDPRGNQRKHLKQTIKKTSVKWNRKLNTFLVVVGPEKNAAPHDHLVHNGTAPHTILVENPPALFWQAGVSAPMVLIEHPGAKANPYLTNAVESTRKESQGIIRREMKAGLDKVVQKLAKKAAAKAAKKARR